MMMSGTCISSFVSLCSFASSLDVSAKSSLLLC